MKRLLDGLELWISRWTPATQVDARDYLVPILGADWRALGALDRMRACLLLPTAGPLPIEACELAIDAVLNIRYPTTAEGRAAALEDMHTLPAALRTAVWTVAPEPRDYPHDTAAAAALAKITRVVPEPATYQHGLFPGQNTMLALLPLRVEYCR